MIVEKALDRIGAGIGRIGVLVGKEGKLFPCTVEQLSLSKKLGKVRRIVKKSYSIF